MIEVESGDIKCFEKTVDHEFNLQKDATYVIFNNAKNR